MRVARIPKDKYALFNKSQFVGRNKLYKSKNGIKISSIVDTNGFSVNTKIYNSACYDSELGC